MNTQRSRSLRRLLALSALLAATSPGCARKVSPQPTPVAAPATVTHDVGGRRLEIALVMDKPRFMSTEPVDATVVFSVPAEPLQLEVSWLGKNDLRQDTSYRVLLLDAGGAALPVRPAGPSFGGQTWTETLAPGHDSRATLRSPRPGG